MTTCIYIIFITTEWNKWPKPLRKTLTVVQSPEAEIEESHAEEQGRVMPISFSCIIL